MSMRNYVPVMQRWAKFREDNKNKSVRQNTTVEVNWEKESAYFRADIYIDEKLVASATSCAPSLGEDKEWEKAETGALGRALAFLGYEAEDAPEQDDSEEKEEKPRRGLGSKRKTEKVEEKEEEPEEDDEEEDSEDDKEDEKNTDGDDEEDSDDEDSEEEDEEEKPAPKAASKSESRLKGVMAKYGMKK